MKNFIEKALENQELRDSFIDQLHDDGYAVYLNEEDPTMALYFTSDLSPAELLTDYGISAIQGDNLDQIDKFVESCREELSDQVENAKQIKDTEDFIDFNFYK